MTDHLEDHYEVKARELSEDQASLSRQKLCNEKEYITLHNLKKGSILDMMEASITTPRRPSDQPMIPLEAE